MSVSVIKGYRAADSTDVAVISLGYYCHRQDFRNSVIISPSSHEIDVIFSRF